MKVWKGDVQNSDHSKFIAGYPQIYCSFEKKRDLSATELTKGSDLAARKFEFFTLNDKKVVAICC